MVPGFAPRIRGESGFVRVPTSVFPWLVDPTGFLPRQAGSNVKEIHDAANAKSVRETKTARNVRRDVSASTALN
jgi:hypothetical protein